MLGHEEGYQWEETWQFILIPYSDGTTRLLLYTRTTLTGVFLMERGLLQGGKQRAEATDPPPCRRSPHPPRRSSIHFSRPRPRKGANIE